MSPVRRFVEADIPQVADLHRRVFRTAEAGEPGWREAYRSYFSEVFLNNPLRDDALGSLVCEEDSGRIVGFMGVAPRRVRFNGRPILVALSSQFVVDPAWRGRVGLRILKRCFEGPQDLSIADEAGADSRRLWEWCGGAAALLYSTHWVRPLRPARFALAFATRRDPGAPLARAAAPVARLVDALVTRLPRSPFRLSPPRGSQQELDEALVLRHLPDVAGDRAVRPNYDDRSLKWVLERASQRKGFGPLRKVLVRDDARDVAGWFLYHARRGGTGEVLQIAAKRETIHLVLDHLLHDAAGRGVIALAGRLEPAFAQALSERYCLLHRRGNWTLMHSRTPELLHAIQRGDAFFTRLEGEWCLAYR